MNENKNTEPKTDVKVPEPKIAKLVLEIKGLDDFNKQLLREELGIKFREPGTRVSGKVKGTGKEMKGITIAKQMQVLIDALPKDRAIDNLEWAKLAKAKGLETNQPPERIVAYYKKQIVQLGFAIVA